MCKSGRRHRVAVHFSVECGGADGFPHSLRVLRFWYEAHLPSLPLPRFQFGQECLDRISMSLGGNAIVPAAGLLLPAWLQVGGMGGAEGVQRGWWGGGLLRNCTPAWLIVVMWERGGEG